MNGKTDITRRMLTGIALAAGIALLAVPMAQARTDDWFRSTAPEPQSRVLPTSDHILDVSARDAAPVVVNDHVLDVSARDQIAPVSSDHVLDVSARTYGNDASANGFPSGGTDWQRIGIGVGLGLGGGLLLVALLIGLVEVRHTRQRLGNA